jgi:EAL domain-containing protein (putative c-di-GMP-specific phosphodiesterase class I)
VGAEALLRWQHPERGLVAPAEFLPIAEDAGLVVALGRWGARGGVPRRRGVAAGADGAAPGVTVNLSAAQLDDPSLVGDVRDALAASGWPRRASPSTCPRTPSRAPRRRRSPGCAPSPRSACAWPSTTSAPATRRRSPTCGSSPWTCSRSTSASSTAWRTAARAAALARTIIALADSLQLRTVAEGVEAPAQQAALEALGCTLGQGFLFARPMPAAEVARRLAPESDFLKA